MATLLWEDHRINYSIVIVVAGEISVGGASTGRSDGDPGACSRLLYARASSSRDCERGSFPSRSEDGCERPPDCCSLYSCPVYQQGSIIMVWV